MTKKKSFLIGAIILSLALMFLDQDIGMQISEIVFKSKDFLFSGIKNPDEIFVDDSVEVILPETNLKDEKSVEEKGLEQGIEEQVAGEQQEWQSEKTPEPKLSLLEIQEKVDEIALETEVIKEKVSQLENEYQQLAEIQAQIEEISCKIDTLSQLINGSAMSDIS